MIRAVAICLALASPAGAQTFEEAVRINFMAAFELCFADHPSSDAKVAAFQQAGFSFSRQTGETAPGFYEYTDTFAAPAGTARVSFYHGQTAPSCTAISDHLGVFEAAQMIADWTAQRFPGRFTLHQAGTNFRGRTLDCPLFIEAGDRTGLPFEIFFGTPQGGGTCADNTSVTATPGRFP